jgi:hypothetical protein
MSELDNGLMLHCTIGFRDDMSGPAVTGSELARPRRGAERLPSPIMRTANFAPVSAGASLGRQRQTGVRPRECTPVPGVLTVGDAPQPARDVPPPWALVPTRRVTPVDQAPRGLADYTLGTFGSRQLHRRGQPSQWRDPRDMSHWSGTPASREVCSPRIFDGMAAPWP